MQLNIDAQSSKAQRTALVALFPDFIHLHPTHYIRFEGNIQFFIQLTSTSRSDKEII